MLWKEKSAKTFGIVRCEIVVEKGRKEGGREGRREGRKERGKEGERRKGTEGRDG